MRITAFGLLLLVPGCHPGAPGRAALAIAVRAGETCATLTCEGGRDALLVWGRDLAQSRSVAGRHGALPAGCWMVAAGPDQVALMKPVAGGGSWRSILASDALETLLGGREMWFQALVMGGDGQALAVSAPLLLRPREGGAVEVLQGRDALWRRCAQQLPRGLGAAALLVLLALLGRRLCSSWRGAGLARRTVAVLGLASIALVALDGLSSSGARPLEVAWRYPRGFEAFLDRVARRVDASDGPVRLRVEASPAYRARIVEKLYPRDLLRDPVRSDSECAIWVLSEGREDAGAKVLERWQGWTLQRGGRR